MKPVATPNPPCNSRRRSYTRNGSMTTPSAESGPTGRASTGRFRRSPATGPLQQWRRQWGKQWGEVNSRLAKAIRGETA